MDFQKIETLLERYWACETSIEEERILKEFFAGAEIPEDLSAYAPFFTYMQNNASLQTGEEFSQNLEQVLKAQEKKRTSVVRYFYPVMKVAASVLIVTLVGLGIHTHNRNQEVLQQVYSETFTDPEEALEEVYYTFDKIGSSLNKAQAALEGIVDTTAFVESE